MTPGSTSRSRTTRHSARGSIGTHALSRREPGEPIGVDSSPWPRVRIVDATYAGPWELPVVGEVPAPPAALIRRDGYVAWAGQLKDPALPEALTAWFGAR